MGIETFLTRPLAPALEREGRDNDVVMSTRIRLARNIEGIPFELKMTDADQRAVLKAFEHAQTRRPNDVPELFLFRMRDLSPLVRAVLVEKHLISPDLMEKEGGAVALSDDETVSVMLNEEDHVRLQVFRPGLDLSGAYALANRLDDWLEETIDWAFDETLGYKTSCPTNTGTGMRASVMMHLPGLVMAKRIQALIPAIQKVGLTVRGVYGEGSEAEGGVFQISNQITLGLSEEEILENLEGIVRQVIDHERASRDMLKQSLGDALEDRIFRSYGILRYARALSSEEALARLSDVLLGVYLGYLEGLSAKKLAALWVSIRPGFLQYSAGKNLEARARDLERARLLREALS